MRIISQDGTMDVPYESSFVYINGRYPKAIYVQTIGDEEQTGFAEYSTPEKAKKAMEMLRNAYTGSVAIFQNVEPTNEVVKALKRQDTEIVCASIDNQPSEIKLENHQNFYFQFPKDDEVEV